MGVPPLKPDVAGYRIIDREMTTSPKQWSALVTLTVTHLHQDGRPGNPAADCVQLIPSQPPRSGVGVRVVVVGGGGADHIYLVVRGDDIVAIPPARLSRPSRDCILGSGGQGPAMPVASGTLAELLISHEAYFHVYVYLQPSCLGPSVII